MFTSIQYPGYKAHSQTHITDAYHKCNCIDDKKWYSLFSSFLASPSPFLSSALPPLSPLLPAFFLLQMGKQLWFHTVLASQRLPRGNALGRRRCSVPLIRHLSSASCSRCQEKGMGAVIPESDCNRTAWLFRLTPPSPTQICSLTVTVLPLDCGVCMQLLLSLIMLEV